MALEIMTITNQRKIPVRIADPDHRYPDIVIDPGKSRAVEADEDWVKKICNQIKGLVWKKGGYE